MSPPLVLCVLGEQLPKAGEEPDRFGGPRPEDDPPALAQCARIGADFGYDEINLNIGCPSERVQEGRFGACLMREPALVGDCVTAMKASVKIPVTVKCRIGVDEQDSEAALQDFTAAVSAAIRSGDRRRGNHASASAPITSSTCSTRWTR